MNDKTSSLAGGPFVVAGSAVAGGGVGKTFAADRRRILARRTRCWKGSGGAGHVGWVFATPTPPSVRIRWCKCGVRRVDGPSSDRYRARFPERHKCSAPENIAVMVRIDQHGFLGTWCRPGVSPARTTGGFQRTVRNRTPYVTAEIRQVRQTEHENTGGLWPV